MKHLHLFEQYPYLVDEPLHEDRVLLLLDMDGALVFEDRHIEPRPHYQEFLTYAFKNFRVGVFTARPPHDAETAIHALGIDYHKLDVVLTEDDCEFDDDYDLDEEDDGNMRELYFIKDLYQLRENLAQVLILDDVPEGCVRNPQNLIVIPPFYGDPTDNLLLRLIPLLEELKDCDDVRRIDKRSWYR